MACPPKRRDNPRAFTSGLFDVQVDKHGINILYTYMYISVDLAHPEIFMPRLVKVV